MEILECKSDLITVRCTKDEARLLENAINETLEAVEAWELPIRTGGSASELEELLQQLEAAIRMSGS